MTDLLPTLDQKFWHLCQCPVFASLSAEDVAALKAAGQLLDVWRFGARVPLSNEPGVYLLKMGYARLIYLGEDGRESTTMLLRPGDLFGSLVDLGDEPAPVECMTITPACFLRIPRARFEALMRQHAEAAYTLSRLSFSGLTRLQSRLAEAMLFPVEVRICRVLADIAERDGCDAEGALRVALTATDVGRLAGTSREFATRHLLAMEADGLLRRHGRRIWINDVPRLRQGARLAP